MERELPIALIRASLFLTCQLASHGVECGCPELTPGEKDWHLLLQIDSNDDGTGRKWGDCGCLYFCIERDALVRKDFERVWCDEQSG